MCRQLTTSMRSSSLVSLLLAVCALAFPSSQAAVSNRVRVFILTDIENEPDDAQSMVRFLTYANHFDVEGLVATTSVHQRDKTAAWRLREIVEAYRKIRDNLEKHEPGFPTAAHLLSMIKEGLPAYGMQAVCGREETSGSQTPLA